VRRAIKAVSFLAALLVFGGIVLLLFVDVNAYKPRVEAAASEALGMDVRVHGRLRISLFPGIGATLEDVRATNRGAEIARAGKIRIGLKLLPLFRREVRTQHLEISDLWLEARGENGKFLASPVTMTVLGGAGRGSMELDLSGEVPLFKARCDVSGFRLEKFLEGVSGKRTLEGKADFSATLSARGKGAAEMKRTVNGEVSLRGENLTLHGIDLDRFLTRYEESQSVSLADAGAFLVAGPLGTALLKGYRVAGIYQAAREEKGTLRRLVSDWKVKNGVAEAKDVALSTRGNRLALTGKLDFVGERFDDVTVSLLDEKGCARATQKIRGPFGDPQLEKVSILKSLASPVIRLFEGAKRLATGHKCEVVYSGSVAHPE
jgi:AsmA protein